MLIAFNQSLPDISFQHINQYLFVRIRYLYMMMMVVMMTMMMIMMMVMMMMMMMMMMMVVGDYCDCDDD